MKVSGYTVFHLLSRAFGDVVYGPDQRALSIVVDYPILYDITADMNGHTVLIPDIERPRATSTFSEVLCICTGEELAHALAEEGLPHIRVRSGATFPQLYNHMQQDSVTHERFVAKVQTCLESYAGFQPLLDALTEAFGCSCTLIDENYRRICYSVGIDLLDAQGNPAAGDVMFEEENADLFMASHSYGHLRATRRPFSPPGTDGLLMKNLFVGDQFVGALLMPRGADRASSQFAKYLLDFLAPFVERMYERIGSYGRDPSKVEDICNMVAAYLSGDKVDAATIDQLLVRGGNPEGTSYTLLVVERSFSHEGAEGLHYLLHRVAQSWKRSYAVVVEGTLYVLVNMGTSQDEHERAFRNDIPVLLRDTMAKGGVSRAFSSMAHLDAARFQAHAALEQGAADDPTYWYYYFDDYALPWVLAHGSSDVPAEYVSHPAAILLARHDEEQGTDLLRTLEVFMACRYNASAAAQRLFVARSTLINRLERIEELTHVDLDDLEERTYLALSLLLMRGR